MMRDPQLYDYWAYQNRPKIRWKNGAKLAFWVAPNIEFYEFDPPQNPFRKPWSRPHPDVRGYAMRDYGNRVGHFRMMEVMDKYGVRGTVSLSVAMCQHHPEIIQACLERNWEFFSHGIYNTRYTYGMSQEQERAIIEDSFRTIKEATGQTIKGWLAPALTHTEHTFDLIAEAGIIYTCDLFQDDQPQPLKVRKGKLISMPYSLEVNDVICYNSYFHSPRHYAQVLMRQFDTLYREGEESGTVMCIPLHAYLVGHPHRIKPFEEALAYITSHPDVWVTTAGEIADYYYEHYYDVVLQAIQQQQALS
ncbi:MAG: polysaccharide deacetylase family protein [Cytophagales bacterium]|nr:polysaccharide deacetylase family protein [Bernardetiaceae bacterium]MDW8210366.1 polysaccharide deacetylase family protein [Cytophagales bacterium]